MKDSFAGFGICVDNLFLSALNNMSSYWLQASIFSDENSAINIIEGCWHAMCYFSFAALKILLVTLFILQSLYSLLYGASGVSACLA